MTSIPVKSHTRKKPEPVWKSGPLAPQIAALIEAKRSGSIAPAKTEQVPVVNLNDKPSIGRQVINIMFQAVGIDRRVRERTDA